MASIDITTATGETDPNSRISFDGTTVTATGVTRSESCWIYKDLPVTITGDYVFDYRLYFNSSSSALSQIYPPSLHEMSSPAAKTGWTLESHGIQIYDTNDGLMTLFIAIGGSIVGLSDDTYYYVRLSRTGFDVKVELFSDAARTISVGSSTTTVGTIVDLVLLQYTTSKGDGVNSNTSTISVDQLDLTYTPAVTSLAVDSDLRWSIQNNVTVNTDARWNINERVFGDIDFQWAIVNTLFVDNGFNWNINLTSLTVDQSYLWSINEQILTDTTIPWNIVTLVQTDIDLRWHIAVLVLAVDTTLQWQILALNAYLSVFPYDSGGLVLYKIIDKNGTILQDWTSTGVVEIQPEATISESQYGAVVQMSGGFQGSIFWKGPLSGVTALAVEGINDYNNSLPAIKEVTDKLKFKSDNDLIVSLDGEKAGITLQEFVALQD